METWLKPIVFGLAALGVLPFILAQLLFCSIRYESGRKRLGKVLIPGTLLNLLISAAVFLTVLALVFHTRTPWLTLERILVRKFTWSDIMGLSLAAAACISAALPAGLLLRRLFFREERTSVSVRCRAAVLLLILLGGTAALAGYSFARAGLRRLTLAEICRKTTVHVIDPREKESLGDGSREICYVILSNPGPLDCSYPVLYLSETEENLTALSFSNITVPARGTARLTMDYEHGLDLKKNGGTTVYLSLGKDALLDQLKVPALAEDDAYRVSSGIAGEVYSLLNENAGASRTLAAPVFSRESGFYETGFDLAISGPDGAEIYYTLDGSDPSVSGIRYTGPLSVTDRTPEENVWSTRTDVSASFLTKNVRYTVPDEPVDKCTVIRAVCMDTDGNLSPVVTGSWFVGFENRSGYDNIGVISIVMDPGSLFDDETGIYVLGNTFLREHTREEEKNSGWWWWAANYHQKGRYWERKASVQFFGPDRQMILSKYTGVRIKGGASAGMLPKSLNLYARKEYDGQPRFIADLFGTGYTAKRVSLSAGGNDEELKIKDWLTARLTKDLEPMVAQNIFIPYCVFLNGEYWGNYWLIEQFDDLYFEYTYGLSSGNAVVIKNNTLKAGTEDDLNLLSQMKAFFRSEDLSLPENYEKACSLVDIENFAAYYALQMYISNQDRSLNRNSILWRARTQEDNIPAGDGRWRWAVFDVNHPSSFRTVNFDISVFYRNDLIFRSLISNSEFRELFRDKLITLATEVFTPERAEEALSEYTDLMLQPMTLEHKRFNGKLTGLDGIEEIRSFFLNRQAYILKLCEAQDPFRMEVGKE